MDPGSLVNGKYRLVRRIGAGGMGEVWAAHHEAIDRHVAIKFPDRSLVDRPEIRDRFLAEARVLGRLQHPNIVDVIDFGELDDGSLFMVFELLDGTSLDARLHDVGRLPPRIAVQIGQELCRGLAFAHEAGVVHRDLKPGNVFLHSAPDGRMQVKIIDFGISKILAVGDEVSITNTGVVVGTPAYMSYEQARAYPDIDARSDLWNMGVLLYEMLSGLPPFEATSYSAAVAKIVAEDPPALSNWGVVVPPQLEAIIRRCLARDRDQRFQSALELRQCLEAVLPVLSEPPPSARVRFESLADLPSIPPPPGGPVSSSSLRLYSPCAVTIATDSQSSLPPASNAGDAPPPTSERSDRSSRARTLALALGALVLVAASVGVTMVIVAPSDDASNTPPPNAIAPDQTVEPPRFEEPAASVSNPAVAASASASASAPVVEVAVPVEHKRTPKTDSDSPKKAKPRTYVDDPGF